MLTTIHYLLVTITLAFAVWVCANHDRQIKILEQSCRELIELEAKGRKTHLTKAQVDEELEEWCAAVEKRMRHTR